MRGIKIPLQDFALKMQGRLMHEAYARGGAHLRDTMVTPIEAHSTVKSIEAY